MSTNSQNDRRTFLRQLGLGAVALGASGLVGKAAIAAPLAAGTTGRGLLDRISAPSGSLVLQDRGDGYHYLVSDGMPEHVTGNFPNANCPFPILARGIDAMMPLKITKRPGLAARPTPLNSWLFGIAVNGVAFDPTGPYWKGDPASGWHFEVMAFARPYLGLDYNNAHTQPSGEYHYHALPSGLVLSLQREQARRGEGERMILLGWAADGFPVYAPLAHRDARDPRSPLVEMRSGYRQKSGARPAGSPGGRHDTAVFVQDYEHRSGAGDLDECNGRFGVTPEFPNGIYHYFVTSAFPFIPRQWKGIPDPSFFHPTPGLDAVPKALQQLDVSKL